jgi:hypothetical protein
VGGAVAVGQGTTTDHADTAPDSKSSAKSAHLDGGRDGLDREAVGQDRLVVRVLHGMPPVEALDAETVASAPWS